MTILSTIVLLGVLIFVHELGHFVAARSVGIRVERFSIGFGPRILGFTRGDTEYLICAIPLGGYVKMGGMEDEIMEALEGGDRSPAEEGWFGDIVAAPESVESRGPRVPNEDDFDSKSVLARAWVISAGVIMNMAFALVTYTVVAGVWGNPVPDTTRFGGMNEDWLPTTAQGFEAIPPGANLVRIDGREIEHWGSVRDAMLSAPPGPVAVEYRCEVGVCSGEPSGTAQVTLGEADEERGRTVDAMSFWMDPVVELVNPGTPAQRAGIRDGDRIVEVGGSPVEEWSQVQTFVQESANREIAMVLDRGGERVQISVTPELGEVVDPVTGEISEVGLIGILARYPDTVFTPVTPIEAMRAGWLDTGYYSGQILGFLRDLFTGRMSARNVGSILAVGEMSGQAAAAGIPVFLRWMALFSINLAILNLLPIPVLDGGHLIFLGIEAVRGQPLSVKQRLRWSQFGFALLVGIMALAIGNDVLRLFGL